MGAKENQVPLPDNMRAVVRATSTMKGTHPSGKSQSGFWVSPRLLISTLHFHSWIGEHPTKAECEMFLVGGTQFQVENEISATVLGPYSPTVSLVRYNVECDLGIFKLQDGLPDREEFVDYRYIIERDEIYQQGLSPGTKAACVGFSAEIAENDGKMIIQQAAYELNRQAPQPPPPVSIPYRYERRHRRKN